MQCGVTPLELTQREDDCDTVIRERLQIYHSTTKPLVEYYALQVMAHEVLTFLLVHGLIESITYRLRRKAFWSYVNVFTFHDIASCIRTAFGTFCARENCSNFE